MTDFVDVGGVNDMQEGTLRRVTVAGEDVVLARAGGNYYAAQGRCPHMGGLMWLGSLNGTILECPRHHSQFDITDGRVLRWTDWTGLKLVVARLVRPPRPLRLYQVKVEGDRVMVGE